MGLGALGWFGISVVLAVIGFWVAYRRNMAGYAVGLDFIETVHERVGDQISRLPLGWFKAPTAGALSKMVANDLMMAGELVVHSLVALVTNSVAVVVICLASWLVNIWLGLAFTLVVPIYVALQVFASKMHSKGKTITEPAEQDLASRLIEMSRRQQALRSCGQSRTYHKLEQSTRQWLEKKQEGARFSGSGMVVAKVVTEMIVAVLMAVAVATALYGGTSPLVAIAYIGIALRYALTLHELTDAVMALQEREQTTSFIVDVLTANPLPEPAEPAVITDPGAVELSDVTFGYIPGETVIDGVSFSAEPATMVALVGPSGCGKTTLARLISRFWDVDSGSVKVGGVDVREQTTQQLMAQLSMVFQDVYLFDDTLRENVRIGRQDATDEEIEQAAALAGVTEIVDRLPDGWDSRVGEGGRALSGGERQRVSIARALLKKAPIVLFDEATSALDPENENNILASTEQLRRHSTLIVIAHKLDTIMRADKIVQLDGNGRVEDIGTHEQLLARDGHYRRFWQARSDATGWKLV
ncbi:ABC transporter ATP-binding protein [Corynebacterium sp. CCM 8862]|uniref:ABC transporter ATP-binding protein n=2 Tax=Corynebacterium mendelii TaxID=2765362 RepID=A0A939E2W1_9CORY|nr:ABC transporter ATP-binding protein [Corynebacterium mendelii]